MAFDRSKFKAARVEVNKQVSQEVEKKLEINSSRRGDYLTIDEGLNFFRMMPPHNEDEPSMQPKAVYWLLCRVPKTDSTGKPIEGEYAWARRPIFDSRIHGGTEKDIVDEYIKFTKKRIFEDNQDKESARKLLAPINGWMGKDGKWNQGILVSTSYVCYATKGEIVPENLGRLELYETDKRNLEKLNIDEESGDIIQTDIFSDPDEGSQFILNRTKNEKGKFINLISKKVFIPKPGIRDYNAAVKEFLESQRVPDSVLEKLSTMEPLSKQFKGAYKRSDFEKALEALRKFDEDNGYHTFENDEFLDTVQEIDGYYPDEEPSGTDDLPFKETESESNDSADLFNMTRAELKSYIKENNLPIKVLASMTDDVIRDMILNLNSDSEEQEKEEEVSNKPTIDPLPFDNEDKKEEEKSAAARLRSRLAAVRNKGKE